jgi:hypothetical protein
MKKIILFLVALSLVLMFAPRAALAGGRLVLHVRQYTLTITKLTLIVRVRPGQAEAVIPKR